MDILIISHFCMDFSKSDNGRFVYLANMMSQDNDVELVTSDFFHATKKHRNKPAAQWPFKITFLHEPGYPQNVCLKRFQSHRVWGKNVEKYLLSRKEPDVVYCAVPSLTGPNLAARYCEKKHIRFVVDVQDIWPEAFKMVFNIPLVSQIVFLPFTALANGIYKRADAICAVSDTYGKRALRVNQKCKKATTVYLGTKLEIFDYYAAKNPVLKKETGEIWLAYCGTLGASYDLACVIDAIAYLKNEKIRFLVMGDGPQRGAFEAYAKKKGVRAAFTGRIPYDKMCGLLAACDITVNAIAHLAAQSIINKHADYAASGLPVVSTQENKEYQELIERYAMGFTCSNGDYIELAEKIKELAGNRQLRRKMGNNARKCAEEKFDREIVYRLLKEQILPGSDMGGVLRANKI